MTSEPAGSSHRPGDATVAIYLMIATGAIALALSVYWLIWGNQFFGGVLVAVLGIAYLYGGRALHEGESSGWGAGVFAGVLFILLGILLLPLSGILIGFAVVVILLLYSVRDYFGMVRYNPEVEEKRKKALETERTSNPKGMHCPHCGSTHLWIALDESAYCTECRTGTISLASTP